jgi:hypothetical protein
MSIALHTHYVLHRRRNAAGGGKSNRPFTGKPGYGQYRCVTLSQCVIFVEPSPEPTYGKRIMTFAQTKREITEDDVSDENYHRKTEGET